MNFKKNIFKIKDLISMMILPIKFKVYYYYLIKNFNKKCLLMLERNFFKLFKKNI